MELTLVNVGTFLPVSSTALAKVWIRGRLLLFDFFFSSPHHPRVMMKVGGAQEKIAPSDEQTSVSLICYFVLDYCSKALQDEGVGHEKTRRPHFAEWPLTLMGVSLDSGSKQEWAHAENGDLPAGSRQHRTGLR